MATKNTALKPPLRRLDDPQSDGRKQNRRRGLHAAVVAGCFAAPIRWRRGGEQRVAAGVHAGPANASKTVGNHRRAGERNEADQIAQRLREQAENHHACNAPAIGPIADDWPRDHAGDAEGRDHQSDNKRRTAEVSNVKRERRLENEMLRVAQEFSQAKQSEGAGPDRFKFRLWH